MKIIYIDLDGVVADFDKGKKEHPLGNVTPYKGRPWPEITVITLKCSDKVV